MRKSHRAGVGRRWPAHDSVSARWPLRIGMLPEYMQQPDARGTDPQKPPQTDTDEDVFHFWAKCMSVCIMQIAVAQQ